MEKNIFGQRLKEIREQEKLTQAKLAKALKVEQTHVSRWERGVIIPDTKTVVSIAVVLRTSTDYLLGLTDSEYPYTYDPKRKGEPGYNFNYEYDDGSTHMSHKTNPQKTKKQP
jgi:transcriptional regulator with XRE-family HTH domain